MQATSPINKSRKQRWLFGVTLAALAGLPAVEAQAEEAESGVRYSRKTARTQAKSNLLDTKFKKETKARSKKKEKPPELMTARDFRDREAVEQGMADEQIRMLKELLKSAEKDSAEYPDFLFRLADHYNEKQHFYAMQAGALYEKIGDAEDKNQKTKANQLKSQQKRHQSDAKKQYANAAKVYNVLTSQPAYKKYKRMDEALYLYAFVLGELEQDKKMKDVFKRLINNYPNSKFIAHAYLAFADHYYEQNQIQNAVKLYEKVIQFPNSPVFAFAMYKLAWCHLNPIGTADPRYDLSLNYFVKTIKATLEGKAGSAAAGKQLRRDTRRDMVRAYIHASRPTKAWGFFSKWGKGPGKDENDVRSMMMRLADIYFANGKYTESTFVYKKMQDEYAGDPSTCQWQGRIVVNSLATDNKNVQWKETKRLGEYWLKYKDGKFKKTVKRKCHDDALNTMKQMATVWHNEAAKTHEVATFELAEQAYGYFREVFPKDKDAYELQYYYAELLWELATNYYNTKDKERKAKGLAYFRKAHNEFVHTLEMNPKGKYTKDAAMAQMLAMKNHLEYDETGGKSKACKTNSEGVCVYKTKKTKKKAKRNKDSKVDAKTQFAESDYTTQEVDMLEAYDRYKQYVKDPKDKELPKIMFHRAKLAMIHNKFTDARPLVTELIEKFDGTIFSAWAAEMLLDMLTIGWVDTNNTPEKTVAAGEDLEKWARKLMEMKVWRHAESERLRENVPTRLAGIGWKKGMAYRDAGARYVKGEEGGDPEGFKKCMEQFTEVFNAYENHPRADTLLWNAADCADAAYRIKDSIQIRSGLLQLFPDSDHAPDTLHYLGQSYQAAAMFKEAAQRFEEFAEKHKKDQRAKSALQNAYLFRLGLGDSEKANEDLKKYEAMFKKKNIALAAKVFWSRHGLLSDTGEKKTHALQYLKTYGKRGGRDREVVAEAVVGSIMWKESCPKELLYDSCITIKRKRALSAVEEIEKRERLERKVNRRSASGVKKFQVPDRCGSATKGIVTVHTRDKKMASDAQKRFSKVLKLVGKGKISVPPEESDRVEAFKNAWGMAMVYRADVKYEEFLALNMPDNLVFGAAQQDWKKDSGIPKLEKEYAELVKAEADSKEKFAAYIARKNGLLAELDKEYAGVKKSGSAAWILAAAARSAAALQNYADQLYRAPVPKNIIKDEDGFLAYCDQLAEVADPKIASAINAYTYCIDRSTEYKFFNDFSRMCEQEMQQTDAEKYPATNEDFGTSIYTTGRLVQVGVLADPSGEQIGRVVKQKPKKAAEGETKAEDGAAKKDGE